MKQLRADDSAGSRVKVGHRQAPTASKPPLKLSSFRGVLLLGNTKEMRMRHDRLISNLGLFVQAAD